MAHLDHWSTLLYSSGNPRASSNPVSTVPSTSHKPSAKPHVNDKYSTRAILLASSPDDDDDNENIASMLQDNSHVLMDSESESDDSESCADDCEWSRIRSSACSSMGSPVPHNLELSDLGFNEEYFEADDTCHQYDALDVEKEMDSDSICVYDPAWFHLPVPTSAAGSLPPRILISLVPESRTTLIERSASDSAVSDPDGSDHSSSTMTPTAADTKCDDALETPQVEVREPRVGLPTSMRPLIPIHRARRYITLHLRIPLSSRDPPSAKKHSRSTRRARNGTVLSSFISPTAPGRSRLHTPFAMQTSTDRITASHTFSKNWTCLCHHRDYSRHISEGARHNAAAAVSEAKSAVTRERKLDRAKRMTLRRMWGCFPEAERLDFLGSGGTTSSDRYHSRRGRGEENRRSGVAPPGRSRARTEWPPSARTELARRSTVSVVSSHRG